MIRNNNIFSKFLLLLILFVGWGGSAWAQRFMPTFAATEAEATTWHYIFFPNNSGDRMYANTNNNQLNWISSQTAPTDHFRWYLIGNSSDFILKTVSGLYAYTTNTGTGTDVQYQVTTDASKATHFDLRNGNNSNTWAIHRKSGGDKNSLNHRNNYGIMEWSVDNGSSFIFSNPKEVIKYSAEPVNGQWDANTQWFSMRNNRSNQGTNNRKFITTSAGGVTDQYDIMPTLATMPNDRGSYWCFVGDASGFVIQNAAYGPDFVLAITGNQSNATVRMFRKDEVPNGYTYRFTAVDNKVIDDGTYAYAFRLGTTGNTHIHVTQGHFIVYTHTAIYGDDTGSAFKLTQAEKGAFDALAAYDVYKVQWDGIIDSYTIDYAQSSKTFGKRGKANQDAYMILESGSSVEKENFTISNPTYTVANTQVTPSAGYYYRNLLLTVRDKAATEPWTVKIRKEEGDETQYKVTFRGSSYADGEIFYWRPNVLPNAIDFNINAPADKFVWGPVFDNVAKTVTYEMRDLVQGSTLPTGWYQLQVAGDEAAIAALRNKIKPEEGNVNTAANTLYLAPAIYEPTGVRFFKVTGVPQYAGEASTFVYVVNNGNNSYSFINPGMNTSITGADFTFSDGYLTKSENWSYETTAYPLEGPYLQAIGSQPVSFRVAPADLSEYNVFQVQIDGNSVPADLRLSINNSDVLGNKTVGNGGYIFMKKDVALPLRSQFSAMNGNAAVQRISFGEKTNDVTPITVSVTTRETVWHLYITGDAKSDNDRVNYKGVNYVNGAVVGIPYGTVPTALEFKTNVTDRFVWGPIIDENKQTVTFEIKNPVNVSASTGTPLVTDGWYQFQLVPYSNGATFINDINSRCTGAKSRSGSYLYLFNADNEFKQNASNYYPVKFAAVPKNGDQATSFLYVKANATRPQFQAINGHYVGNSGYVPSGPDGVNKLEAITAENIYGVYRWFRYDTGSDEAPYMGASGTGRNFYVRAVKVDPTTMYDVYQVNLSGTGLDKVRFIGNNNHGINEVFNNGYFFLTKGTVPTKENFRLDGGVEINSISISASNVITFNISTPTYGKQIIHRQAYYYDDIETDPYPPTDGFIKEGEGMGSREGTDGTIREQNMAVFEIPVYLRQGTTYTGYMPTDQVKRYQRWYNWDNDGLVDPAVLTSLPGWNVSAANTYTNGHLTGTGYGSFQGSPVFTLPLPANDSDPGMTAYNVGLDMAHYPTRGNIGSGLVEPTLAMRIVYQVRDAKIIAKAIKDSTANDRFYEVHNVAFPNVKHGNLEDKTIGNLISLDMDLNNYWIFDGDGETNNDLLQLKQSGGAQLRVELASYSNGAELKNVKMIDGTANASSGNIKWINFDRGHFILFQYPDGGVVPAGSTATINVYIRKNASSKEYKLAQFNLSFIGNSEPVAVTELKGTNRHPDALTEAFGSPVAELTFDNKTNNEFGNFYKYPLNYKGVSYAFGTMVSGGGHTGYFASRGEYGLGTEYGTSGALGGGTYNYYPVNNYLRNMGDVNAAISAGKEGDSYCLYIDAADQPGKIASIELEDALCAGSRLYCYGYIGCTSGSTGQNPTSVLINVMGINKDTGKEELIYSYCPGIITLRAYDKDNRRIYASALGRETVYEPHGSQQNYWAPWQQIGFSFAIDAHTAAQMRAYSVQIVNNAWNSDGADTVLDDFEIYVKKPGAEVQNTTPLCSDQIRHIKVITEYQTLLEATGEDSNHDGLMNVGFCFLDKEVYDLTLAEHADQDAEHGYPRNDPNNKYNLAFGEALMGKRTLDKRNKDHAFHNFDIIRDGEISDIYGEKKVHYYTDIPQYSFKESGDDVVYRDSIRGERYIVFKESVAHGEPSGIEKHKWTAGKSYYLLFSTATISEQHVLNHDLGCTVFNLDDNKCSVLYEFTVAPPVTIKGDAEHITSGDEVQACAGQTATLTVNLNGRTDTKDVIIKNLNYDWWMSAPTHEVYKMQYGVPMRDANGHRIALDSEGNEIANDAEGNPVDPSKVQHKIYNTVPATLQNYMNVTWGKYSADHAHLDKKAGEPVYLSDALLEFRRAYPNATDLVGVVPIKNVGDTVEYDLTQDLINCVAHFLEPDENGYPPLLLMKKEMNLTLGIDYADEEKTVHFVVIPIAPSIYSVDEDAIYCPDPQELKVKLLNEAPSLANGFNNLEYPDVINNVPMRVGLQQINAVRQRSQGDQRTLTVPLRKAAFAYPEVGHRLIKKLDDTKIYIVGSDDPAYKKTETENVTQGTQEDNGEGDDDLEDMFTEAGEVISLTVEKGDKNPSMQIVFNSNVIFREGYTYTMKIRYYEVMEDNERDNACEGSFVFDLKVVPEYQEWTGLTGNSDWTNDRNWARADRNKLYAGATATGDKMPGATALDDATSYVSNAVNTTSGGFVPMYFTNVLVQKNDTNSVVLYKGSDFQRPISGEQFLQGLDETATPFINYDMEVTPVNAADRTAYNYDCDYKCELFDTYIANGVNFSPGAQMGNAHYLAYNKAWVECELDANRWYTLASPLKKSFSGDWYSPTAGAKQQTPYFYDINYNKDLNDRFRPAYYQRSWDRDGNNTVHLKSGGTYDSYVVADWSNVYNDAKVNYSAGGFSVKAEFDYMDSADVPRDSMVLVRLPKADTSYTYYSIDGTTGQAADAQLGSRTESYRLHSDDLKGDGTGIISMTVTNETTDNNFLLLSNPFMAAMDMDRFFELNTDLEEKYWIVSADRQDVSMKTAGEWISTTGSDKYVAPMQGFFVKKKAQATPHNSITAKYNAGMQTVINATETQPAPAIRSLAHGMTPANNIIRMTALRGGVSSTAVIVIRDDARDTYVSGEDCETFIDGNIYDKPTVYTSSASVAQSINVRQSLEMVPVGMISSDDSDATLRFDLSGSNYDTLYLYDLQSDEYTELSDGTEVTMKGNNAGRYFLTTTTMTEIDTDGDQNVRRGVWTISGAYLGTSVQGMMPGIYVVDGVKMYVR